MCDVGMLKQGPDLGERGSRLHHGDEVRLLIEALAETGNKDVDELAMNHGITEFVKLVGNGVEALAVRVDGASP
jgi:hypothetical protein